MSLKLYCSIVLDILLRLYEYESKIFINIYKHIVGISSESPTQYTIDDVKEA